MLGPVNFKLHQYRNPLIIQQEILGAVIYKLLSIFSGGKEANNQVRKELIEGAAIETYSLWGTRAGKTGCAAERWKPN